MRRAPALLLVLGVVACGDDTAIDPKGYVIQITKVQYSPAGVPCGGRDFDYLFLINVSMANTTADTVTLTTVSSAATYVDTGPALDGTQGRSLTRTSIPFTPIVLRSRDGVATTTVSLGGKCPSPTEYGTMTVTLFMHTNRGVFATAPFRLSLVF